MQNESGNHLAKANHLRFSLAIWTIAVLGLGFVGVQKVMQWRAEEAAEAERNKYVQWAARKKAGREMLDQTRADMRQKLSTPPHPRSTQAVAAKTPASEPSSENAEQESPAVTEIKVDERHPARKEELLTAAVSSSGGSIRGKVSLSGTPQPERPIEALRSDPICGKLHENPPTTHFFRVGNQGGLADTIVYIRAGTGDFDHKRPLYISANPNDVLYAKKGVNYATFDPPSEPVLIDQVGCQYAPYVFVLQTGQKLLVRNSDPVLHNVHPTPIVAGNRESNRAQMPKSSDLEFVFEKPEQFLRIKCDVHPWMFSYAFVISHPYATVTDADGFFTLTNVPPGTYVVEAIHRKAGSVTKTVEVGKNEIVLNNFILSTKPEGTTASF